MGAFSLIVVINLLNRSGSVMTKLNSESCEDVVYGDRGLCLSESFVLKGADVLLAFMKSEKYLATTKKSSKPDLLESDQETMPININFSIWTGLKGQNRYFPVKVKNLPHNINAPGFKRKVCLIVPNVEGKTNAEVCEFYKNVAEKVDNKQFTYEAVTWKELKTLMETFADKRKVVKSYDLFLADRSLECFILPKLGVTFKRAKKMPLLFSLNNRKELEGILSGTHFFLSNEAMNYSYKIGHTSMTSKQICENVIESLNQLAKNLENGWRNVKTVGLIGHLTSFIPIYDNSDAASLAQLNDIYQQYSAKKQSVEEKVVSNEEKPESKLKIKSEPGLKVVKAKTKFSKISQLKMKLGMAQEKLVHKENLKSKQQKVKSGKAKKQLKQKLIESETTTKQLNGSISEENVDNFLKAEPENLKVSERLEKAEDDNAKESQLIDSQSVEHDKSAPVEKVEAPKKPTTNVRSLTDVAMKKHEKRKLKRQLQENDENEEVQLTAFEKKTVFDQPPTKKQKSAPASPKLTGREKSMFDGPAVKKQKVELLSPKLTGLEKHILNDEKQTKGTDEVSKKQKKANKKKSNEGLTGYEKNLFTQDNNDEKNSANIEKVSERDDVEIPEGFFGKDDDFDSQQEVSTAESHDTVSDDLVAPTPKRTTRKTSRASTVKNANSVPTTPLRRSSRVMNKPVV